MEWFIALVIICFVVRCLAASGKPRKPTVADCLAEMRRINDNYTSEKPGPVYQPLPPGSYSVYNMAEWEAHTAARMRQGLREEYKKGWFGKHERKDRPWLDPAGHEDNVVDGKWKE